MPGLMLEGAVANIKGTKERPSYIPDPDEAALTGIELDSL